MNLNGLQKMISRLGHNAISALKAQPRKHDLVQHTDGSLAVVHDITDDPYHFGKSTPCKVVYVIGSNVDDETGELCGEYGDHWYLTDIKIIASNVKSIESMVQAWAY